MCTPEAHIIHLQQAMCSMIKAMKMHFMDWLATQILKNNAALQAGPYKSRALWETLMKTFNSFILITF